MTEHMYLVQVALLGLITVTWVWREHWILRAQIAVWIVGTVFLYQRYGVEGQLNFYSNDQRLYTLIVQDIASAQVTFDVDFWLTYAKSSFTLPAAVLASIGVEPSLALKWISLSCLLLLTRYLLRHFEETGYRRRLLCIYLSACGGIGLLYSVLALRETMMMWLTTLLFLDRSPATRATALFLLFLLRPHLAITIAAAVLAVEAWVRLRHYRSETPFSVGLLLVGGIVGGYFLFSIGVFLQYGIQGSFGHQWGIGVVTRVVSNFFGLQFLTARSETVEFSLRSLLVLRLILSETIVIPAAFTFAVFLRADRLEERDLYALLAFAIYVGLVTNTEFNSFRQNIPLMPIMGITICASWSRSQCTSKREIQSECTHFGMTSTP